MKKKLIEKTGRKVSHAPARDARGDATLELLEAREGA